MAKSSEITADDLAAHEATFADVKADYRKGKVKADEYRGAKRGLVSLRAQFRAQEEAAGRRSGFAGGDAVKGDD